MPEDKTIHATHREGDDHRFSGTLLMQCGKPDYHLFAIVPYDFLRLLDCSSHDVDRPLCGKCAKVLKGNRKLVD